jgi:Zn-dependent membrane protease YugP
MDNAGTTELSIPDALIAWTTAAALVAFGIIFFDDAVIMGRTILTLGVLSGANEALKLRAVRVWSGGACQRVRRVRLAIAIAYVALVLIGFLFPPSGP